MNSNLGLEDIRYMFLKTICKVLNKYFVVSLSAYIGIVFLL